jgi:hypothetical protein
MSFSYTIANLSQNGLDRVRFEIGDTDSTEPLLEDEEIEFCLSQTGSFYRATSMAAHAIATRLSREASFTAGNLKVDLATRAKSYADMAARFKAWAEQEESPLESPVAGGLPDPACGPTFYRGMMDYSTSFSGGPGSWY